MATYSRDSCSVAEIVPHGEEGKFKLIFSEPAKSLTPIPFGNAPSGSMQGPRHTIRGMRSC